MKISVNKIKVVILCLLSLTPTSIINAAQLNNFLEFSFSAQNQTANLEFSSTTYKTKTNQLGLNWYEPFTQYFHGGLELGILDVTQIDNTLASAQFTSGEYAGLLLRFIPLETETLSLTLNVNYRYSATTGKASNQETQFAWHETLFSTELHYQPIKLIGLMLGAEYQTLDGEQRDSGTVTKITEFTESERLNYRFGVNFTSNRTGVVGIEWLSGFKSGTRLYFLRKF